MSNPIESVIAWMHGVGHGLKQLRLYEGLCAEEGGETLQEFVLVTRSDDGSMKQSTVHNAVGASLEVLANDIRGGDYGIGVPRPAKLLDAHLDSAWVHLCAALALVDGDADKLRAAWAELHRSNVLDKQVDGQFVKDASGKVQKPASWTEPDFEQFFA